MADSDRVHEQDWYGVKGKRQQQRKCLWLTAVWFALGIFVGGLFVYLLVLFRGQSLQSVFNVQQATPTSSGPSFANCLPYGIGLNDVVSMDQLTGANQITVEQTLTSLGARCDLSKITDPLVDRGGKGIRFYRTPALFCWGVTTDPKAEEQRATEVASLQEQGNYLVIELTCGLMGP